MRAKHKSLQELWNEWYGLEEYFDEHGGINGREAKYGSKWRKGLINSQQFSRTQRIIKGIRNYSISKQVGDNEAIALLEDAFQDCKCSAYNFVRHLQQEGFITKQGNRCILKAASTGAAIATESV